MKKIIVLLLCGIWMLCVHAQTVLPPGATASAGPAPTSIDSERARISLQRAQLEGAFKADDAACYSRYMVNNCLEEVQGRRREALADLRRQEISLNEQERRAKAAAQVLKTEEKSSPQTQQEASEKRAAAARNLDERVERDRQKNAGRAQAQSAEEKNRVAAASRGAASARQSGGRAAARAGSSAEVKKFDERQEKARERLARHERDKAAQSKPAAKSLPVPE